VHFNHTALEDQSLEKLADGSYRKVNIRYGIIELDDMLRDLETWETLLVSSFMQRPYEILIQKDNLDHILQK